MLSRELTQLRVKAGRRTASQMTSLNASTHSVRSSLHSTQPRRAQLRIGAEPEDSSPDVPISTRPPVPPTARPQ